MTHDLCLWGVCGTNGVPSSSRLVTHRRPSSVSVPPGSGLIFERDVGWVLLLRSEVLQRCLPLSPAPRGTEILNFCESCGVIKSSPDLYKSCRNYKGSRMDPSVDSVISVVEVRRSGIVLVDSTPTARAVV